MGKESHLKEYAIWSNHKVVGYVKLTEETADELNRNGCYFGYDRKTAPKKYKEDLIGTASEEE